ncbi:MAG: hotdog fold thioesterase [Candidatus Bathyarchaeota archaeon]|nr:hotdog fold thioesterase [Candidatus Bathyarchaeota archaeon]
MRGNDYFRELLGIKVLDAKDGYSKMSLKIAKEHTNFVGFTHGGVVFALADCAFAEAVNFGDKQAVAVQVSINFLRPSSEGDVLTAEAITISEGKTFVLCSITVSKKNKTIALFSGLAYKMQSDKAI